MEQTWLQYFNPPKLFCFLDKSCTKYFVTDKKYGRFGLCLQNHGNVILKESFKLVTNVGTFWQNFGFLYATLNVGSVLFRHGLIFSK